MAEWITVAKAVEIPVNTAKAFTVGGTTVAVFNLNGSFYAINDECSHAGGPLCDGSIEGNTVACPWHGAVFDITTGAAKTAPACDDVACFKVRLAGDDVQVEI